MMVPTRREKWQLKIIEVKNLCVTCRRKIFYRTS